MEQFKGFPAKTEFTAVPNAFFSRLLPQISDLAELKVTLHLFNLLYRKRGYPRLAGYRELLADKGLMSSLKEEEALRRALEMAAQRGTILHLAMEREGTPEDIYLLNDEPGRRTMARIESGALKLAKLEVKEPALVDTEEKPDIVTLYEKSIGILDPITAGYIHDALQTYPEDWIRDAIKEAVALNKRSWRYIEKILENWTAEGRSDGTHRGHSEKTDPDKYIKGKYGHIVQR